MSRTTAGAAVEVEVGVAKTFQGPSMDHPGLAINSSAFFLFIFDFENIRTPGVGAMGARLA